MEPVLLTTADVTHDIEVPNDSVDLDSNPQAAPQQGWYFTLRLHEGEQPRFKVWKHATHANTNASVKL